MISGGGVVHEYQLGKTVNDKDFNQVFTEVFHSEGLGVHANSELRLFRLKDVTDFHFLRTIC